MTYHPDLHAAHTLQRRFAAAGWMWVEPEPIVTLVNAGGRVEVCPRADDDNLLVASFGTDGRQDEVHVELDGAFAAPLPVLTAARETLTVDTFPEFVARVRAICPRSIAFVDR